MLEPRRKRILQFLFESVPNNELLSSVLGSVFLYKIINHIIPKLQEMKITFHICSNKEIDEIKQKVYPKKRGNFLVIDRHKKTVLCLGMI